MDKGGRKHTFWCCSQLEAVTAVHFLNYCLILLLTKTQILSVKKNPNILTLGIMLIIPNVLSCMPNL